MSSVQAALLEVLDSLKFGVSCEDIGTILSIILGRGDDTVSHGIERGVLALERRVAHREGYDSEHDRVPDGKIEAALVALQQSRETPNDGTQMPLRLLFETHILYGQIKKLISILLIIAL